MGERERERESWAHGGYHSVVNCGKDNHIINIRNNLISADIA